MYNSQGTLWRQTSHTYDEAGRLTQAVSTDVDGDLWFRNVYTYTEDGQPAHIDHHDPDGTFLHRASFTYDGEGRVAKRSLSDADGCLRSQAIPMCMMQMEEYKPWSPTGEAER